MAAKFIVFECRYVNILTMLIGGFSAKWFVAIHCLCAKNEFWVIQTRKDAIAAGVCVSDWLPLLFGNLLYSNIWAMALWGGPWSDGHEAEADVSIKLKDSNEATYGHTNMLGAWCLSGERILLITNEFVDVVWRWGCMVCPIRSYCN